MLPCELGDSVTMVLEGRPHSGRVTGITAQSVELTFPWPAAMPAARVQLRWPGALEQELDLGTTAHHTQLVLRLPIERVPAPPEARIHPDPHASSLGMTVPSEMRRSVRVPVELPITLVDLATHTPREAATVDVSGGGARVASPQPLIVGREYLLTLPVGPERVTLHARVLRRLTGTHYAVKFLCEREEGHRLMRRLFAVLRGEAPPPKSARMNFRRT